MRFLTAIPVHNEERHLEGVLDAASRHAPDILVVDDGSTDGTPQLLAGFPTVRRIRHERNEGYGAALRSAFVYTIEHEYEVLVTMDCDGQHEPHRIPELLATIDQADIVSGSRYLRKFDLDSIPPEDRRQINRQITEELNHRFGLRLTDAFCGFKAYRAGSLARFDITEPGYGMPLELWVQAAGLGLRIQEVPVPLIYLDEKRAFGGSLDDATRRRAYYHEVIERTARRWPAGESRSKPPGPARGEGGTGEVP